GGSFGSEDPQCGSRDEVALEVEGAVDGGVHAEEALGGSSRLEPLQLALASSHRLMRALRAIVLAQPLLVTAGEAHRAKVSWKHRNTPAAADDHPSRPWPDAYEPIA